MKKLLRKLGVGRPKAWDKRVEGNAARNAGNWPLAAAAYEQYLQYNSHDWQIWVQCGHAHKESGNPGSAERAYRYAAEIASEQFDPLLHLGHLLKGMGRIEESLEIFRRGALLPDGQPARAELEAYGIAPPVPSVEQKAAVPSRRDQYLVLVDAQAARDQRRWEDAVSLYVEFISFEPRSIIAWTELSFVHAAAGNYAEASDAIGYAIALAPTSTDLVKRRDAIKRAVVEEGETAGSRR